MEFGRNLCKGHEIKEPCEGGGLVGDVVLTEMNTWYGELMVNRINTTKVRESFPMKLTIDE